MQGPRGAPAAAEGRHGNVPAAAQLPRAQVRVEPEAHRGHMQELFGEQGMTWNELERAFEVVEERAYPPAAQED